MAVRIPQETHSPGTGMRANQVSSPKCVQTADRLFAQLAFLEPVVLHELYLRKVILYPNGVVCKSSQGLPIAEAKALEVASEAGLPAPRSFGGFKAPFETICNGNEIPDSGTVYAEGFSPVIHVHMSHVPGQPLDKLWKDMAEDQRRNIARQLGEIVKKMRAVPPPPNYIGTCDGKQIRDPRLYDTYTGPTCDSEQAFNEWLISEIRSVVAPLVKEAFARRLRTGHRIVLSHCDLTPRNIMVDEEGKNITGLIDWENSGWYPEYWEYVKFFHSYSTDGWRNYAEYIFPEIYHDELIEYTALLRYQK
ncbi:kinase-like protein [Xylariaceae sp. FL0594]|nr:kinase-like protein [Xylariaceae sp. FL0594]